MVKILKLPKFWKVFNVCLLLMEAQWNSYAKLKVHLVHKLLGLGTYLLYPMYIQYQNIRKGGVFPVLGLFLKFPIFSLLAFLSLTRSILKFFKIFALVS